MIEAEELERLWDVCSYDATSVGNQDNGTNMMDTRNGYRTTRQRMDRLAR